MEAEARLAEEPDESTGEARRAWELRLEGILREIDAGFAPASLDPAAHARRAALHGLESRRVR